MLLLLVLGLLVLLLLADPIDLFPPAPGGDLAPAASAEPSDLDAAPGEATPLRLDGPSSTDGSDPTTTLRRRLGRFLVGVSWYLSARLR